MIRAIAGMTVGMIVYLIYKKYSAYQYTSFAKKGGTMVSIFLMWAALWLSVRPKSYRVNTFGWRALIVVLLYATAILSAFLFAGEYPKKIWAQKIFVIGGKWAMTIYMTHTLIIYLVKVAEIPYGRRTYMIVMLGTIVASVLLELCVQILYKASGAAVSWLKKMCLVQTTE